MRRSRTASGRTLLPLQCRTQEQTMLVDSPNLRALPAVKALRPPGEPCCRPNKITTATECDHPRRLNVF
jgi:hypothetical protein